MSERSARATTSGRARVEIDLGALARNFRTLASTVSPARLLPVLKADAYGHGAIEVARALAPLGAAGFAVARAAEGGPLRDAGIDARILVFAPTGLDDFGELARFDLTPVVSDLEQLELLERFAAASGWRPAVHLKVDTGMHRLGLPLAAVPAAMARLRSSRYLVWEGLLSHLADAGDVASGSDTQLATFREVLNLLSPAERQRLEVHLANSAGALLHSESRFDLVRPGLALFGCAPAGAPVELEPVLSLYGTVLQVQRVAPGEAVGYGGRWRAARPSRIGVVGVGYADGYPWRAAGSAEALVDGRRVPLVGAVSMDLLAVDLTDVSAAIGDEVVLVGRQGGEEIRVEELARHGGTIPYEIVCSLRLRLPRRFISSSEVPTRRLSLASGGESGG